MPHLDFIAAVSIFITILVVSIALDCWANKTIFNRFSLTKFTAHFSYLLLCFGAMQSLRCSKLDAGFEAAATFVFMPFPIAFMLWTRLSQRTSLRYGPWEEASEHEDPSSSADGVVGAKLPEGLVTLFAEQRDILRSSDSTLPRRDIIKQLEAKEEDPISGK